MYDTALANFGAAGYVPQTNGSSQVALTDPDPQDNPLQKWIYEQTPVGQAYQGGNAIAGAVSDPIGTFLSNDKSETTLLARDFLFAIVGLVLVGVGAAALLEG